MTFPGQLELLSFKKERGGGGVGWGGGGEQESQAKRNVFSVLLGRMAGGEPTWITPALGGVIGRCVGKGAPLYSGVIAHKSLPAAA